MAPAVWAAMERVARAGGNPSSVHRLGQVARGEVDDAERHIAALVGMASASFAYAADPCEATSFALEQALRERTGPRGGRVRLWGCRSRWQPVLQNLLRTRGGQVACGPDGVLWSAPAGAATEGGAVDVFAYDAWHPLSGEPIFLPEADFKGAHLHAVAGAFDLGHHGEPWPQSASRSADTVAVSSAAVGGPWGLCALVRRGAGAALPTTGSLPTALIAGLRPLSA